MGEYTESFNTVARKTGEAALLALGIAAGAISGTAHAQTYDPQQQQQVRGAATSQFLTHEQRVLQQKPWAADPAYQERLELIKEKYKLDMEQAQANMAARHASNAGTSGSKALQSVGTIIGILGQRNSPGLQDDAQRASKILRETGRMGENKGRTTSQDARNDAQFLKDKQTAEKAALTAALKLNKEFAEPYLKQARELDRQQRGAGPAAVAAQPGEVSGEAPAVSAPVAPSAADVAAVQRDARAVTSMDAACTSYKKRTGKDHPKCK
jgi:hypothetical protein